MKKDGMNMATIDKIAVICSALTKCATQPVE